MTRHAPALLALSIVAVAGWTYNVNYDTRTALDRLSGLRAEIAEEREALQVLRVEWAYLNAPDRLAGLVAAHKHPLGLVPLVPEGLGIAAAVPYPPRATPEVPPAAPDALIAAAPATRPPAEAAPEAEPIVVAALSEPGGAAAVPPAAPSPVAPASQPAAKPAAETVPEALEAAIAAALVEVGVPLDENARPGRPRGGVIVVPAVPAGAPVGVYAGAMPVPAARPVAWSGR